MRDVRYPPQSVLVSRSRPRRDSVLAGLAALMLLIAAGAMVRLLMTTQQPIHIAMTHQGIGADETLTASHLYLDEVNHAGGINGRPVVLDQLDDKANEASITAGPALAVLGRCPDSPVPGGTADSQGDRIPALSSQLPADDAAAADPYCFRAQTRTAHLAQWLAHYIQEVLLRDGAPALASSRIELVISNDAFGKSFGTGFIPAMGEQLPRTWTLDVEPYSTAGATRALVNTLAQEPEPRIIVIGIAEDKSTAIVKAIRRQRVNGVIVLNAPGGDAYLENFRNEPEETEAPGFFTRDMYVATPLIFDAIGMLGRKFAADYASATGKQPSWLAAEANDAMRIVVEALRRAHPTASTASKAADRDAVRAGLAGIDSPEHAVAGLDGPLYFEAGRDMPRPLRIGTFDRGRLVSAPLQLVAVQHAELVDLIKGLRSGTIINVGANFFWVQRVVYAGIDITHLNYIDVQAGTFNADLYVWLRYGGDNADPTHIEFPDLKRVDSLGGFDPAKPVEQGELEGLNYRLYRIAGDFTAGFDLHDYPFDTQSLVIRFQNHEQPRQQVSYVTDTFGLRLHRADQTPLAARSAFADLQLWHVSDLRYFVDSFSISSTQGKPALFDNDSRNEYGGFDAAIVVQRDVIAFMVKTLAPLFMLVLVVFATLFFPQNLAAERTSIPVTGFLTSAVLLVSISNQLPTLGYTMALAYMFYVFFGLCLMVMCAGFLTERLLNQQHANAAIMVNNIARIAYAGVVLLTIGGFVLWFTLR